MIYKLAEIRRKRLVLMSVYRIVKNQQKCRENYDNGKNADYNALGHNDSDVKAERKLHKAQRKKAEKRSQRAAGKRNKRAVKRS